MPWYDELIPARLTSSVGSQACFMRTAGKTGGRRTQAHEYADVDGAFVEDSGGMPNRYQLTLFVVGPNYHVDLQRLEEILETDGSLEFSHPFRGTIYDLRLEGEYASTESTEKMGIGEVTLTLVQDAQPTPQIFESLSNVTVARAGAVFAAAEAEFLAAYSGQDLHESSTNFLKRVGDALQAAYFNILSKFGPIAEVRNAVNTFRSQVNLIGSLPGSIISQFLFVERVLNSITAKFAKALGRPSTGYGNPLSVLTDSATSVSTANSTPEAVAENEAVTSGSAVGGVSETAKQDLDALQVLAMATALAALTETLTIIELPTADAAQELSDFIAAFADDLLEAPIGDNPISSDLYDATLFLQRDIVALLGQIADELPPVTSYEVPSTMPLSIIAFSLTGDDGEVLSTLVRELVRVNVGLDPLFVAQGEVVTAVLP